MSEYNIVKRDFEKQKKELKSFSEQPATSTQLDKFSTSGKFSDFLSGGLFGLIDHKVTGEEMNVLVTALQSCFAEINERDRKVIKEFGQVYETFEALDKGYIQGILIGVKSAEEASKEAKAAQKDIDDTIKALKLTVQKLQEFKNEVKGHVHLKDIDEMWDDLKRLEKDADKVLEELKKKHSKIEQRVSDLEKHKASLLKLSHLKDVDTMWDKLHETEENISELTIEIGNVSKDINGVKAVFDGYKTKLDGIAHLEQVDEMWNTIQDLQKKIDEQYEILVGKIREVIENANAYAFQIGNINSKQDGFAEQLSEFENFVDELKQQEHLGEIDVEWNYSHELGKIVEKVTDRIAETESKMQIYEERLQEADNEKGMLKSRIKTVYIVAGLSIGISIIQFILFFLGVL